MAKSQNNQFKNNKNSLPTKADAEIAGENSGLEKIAIKAQRTKNK